MRSPLPSSRQRPGRSSPFPALALALIVGLALPRAGHLLPGGAPAGTERARVLEVIDGDTLVLADGRHVRLLGIDTPETRHPEMRGPQPLGAEAAATLRQMVEGRTVALERDRSDTDHYGRLLRHVWLGRRLVSEQLLRQGLAWSLVIPPDIAHRERLARAEAHAKAAGRGLWGLPRPTALPIFAQPEALP